MEQCAPQDTEDLADGFRQIATSKVSHSRIPPFEPETNNYGETVIHGGNVLLGNCYVSGMSREDLVKFEEAQRQQRRELEQEIQTRQEVQEVLSSLRFSEMGARANQIKDTHTGTFTWVLNKKDQTRHPADFATWLVGPQRAFWVSGKPGSGKSTLMKFLALHADTVRLLSEHFQSTDILILSFYFWLHGREDQRTLRGCLCALLYDLLLKDDELARQLVVTNRTVARKKNASDWSVGELKSTLLSTLSMGQKQGCIFLDGLDEFDKDSDLADVLELVRDLSEVRGFKICISSRQELPFEKAFAAFPKLRLQDLTRHDIRVIARKKLGTEFREADYNATDQEGIDRLARTIAFQAEGVFLWAVMAIKSLCIGIRNEDNMNTLLRRLRELPREMTTLYEQMWLRLHDDGGIYRDDTATYLTLSQHIPLSLLEFTLAVDDSLRQSCMSLTGPPDTALLKGIVSACKALERKIRIRTAGLLEVVAGDVQSDADFAFTLEALSCPENRVCICGLEHPRSPPRCCSRRKEWQLLQDAHDKKVQFVHRSVADFITSSLNGRQTAQENLTLQKGLYRKLVLAQYVVYTLDCHCTFQDPAEHLMKTCTILEAADASALLNDLTVLGASFYSRWVGSACPYGWDHGIFNRRWRSTVVDPWKRPYETYLDFPGLMAAFGRLDFLQIYHKSCSARWSLYYTAYLCLCSIKGVNRSREGSDGLNYFARARTILWLIGQGADMLTPQLSVTDIGNARLTFVPRPVLADAWLFVLRLLVEGDGHLNDRMSLANCLAALLSKQQYSGRIEVVWSICSESKLCDLRVPLKVHKPPGLPSFWLVVKMSMEELQAFVTDTIAQIAPMSMYNINHRTRLEDICNGTTLCQAMWLALGPRASSGSRASFYFNSKSRPQPSDFPIIHTLLQAIQGSTLPQPSSLGRWEAFVSTLPSATGTRSCGHERVASALMHHLPNAVTNLHFDFQSIWMVPPDTSLEVTGSGWYEHGVLREWHRRRQSGVVTVEQGTRDFEAVNGLTPRYETASDTNMPVDEDERLVYLLKSSKAGGFEHASGDESTEFSEISSEED